MREDLKLGLQTALGTRQTREFMDARRHPRYKLEVAVRVYPRNASVVRGHTVDISESGISVMLRVEIPMGEVVPVVKKKCTCILEMTTHPNRCVQGSRQPVAGFDRGDEANLKRQRRI